MNKSSKKRSTRAIHQLAVMLNWVPNQELQNRHDLDEWPKAKAWLTQMAFAWTPAVDQYTVIVAMRTRCIAGSNIHFTMALIIGSFTHWKGLPDIPFNETYKRHFEALLYTLKALLLLILNTTFENMGIAVHTYNGYSIL